MNNEHEQMDARMDVNALCREDVYTDRRVGTIRVLTPVNADGERDISREVEYIGQASLYTPAGALPLNFELAAKSLSEAIEKFPEAAQKAVEETMEQLREMRREAASSIITPGRGGPGPGGQGGFGGIQMP